MNELEEIKKEKPTERWKPSQLETYKIIFSDGKFDVLRYDDDAIDRARVDFGNAFPPDMPLEYVVMLHQFINEMELICWQLGVISSRDTGNYTIPWKGGKICYRFDSKGQWDKAYSMLSDKVKKWLEA